MSRQMVRVGAFLFLLSSMLLPPRGFGVEPPKKADDGEDPFGDAAPATPARPGKAVGIGKTAPAAKPVPPANARPRPKPGQKLHGGEKAILKALKQEASFDFAETPLKDVVEYISDKFHIPVLLDRTALKEAGVNESTPVNCRLSGISLQSALEIILEELQLKWTIHHDVLMITSPTKAESDEFTYTRSYDVADLVNQPADFSITGNPLTAPSAMPQNGNTGLMVMGQGGGSGNLAGVGSAGGMGGYPQTFPKGICVDVGQIKDLITNAVCSRSWVDNGGNGRIDSLGNHVLVISQTRENHIEVEKSLAELRASRRAEPALAVELHWLWLDAAHRGQLLAGHGNNKPGSARVLNSRRLRQIAAEVPHFHANVGCINGVGAAFASGDRRSLIVSAIPVVGSGIGYSPVISVPNVGITAELRPTVTADHKAAMLFVQSTITRRAPSRKPAIVGSAWPADQETSVEPPAAHTTPASPPIVHIEKTESGSGSCPIDLPVMPTQEFGTTLRVPLGKPVIVGSVTFAPEGDAGLGAAKQDAVEVYLIATTTIVKKAK